MNNGLAPNNSNGGVDGGDCKNNGKKGRSSHLNKLAVLERLDNNDNK